MTTRHHAFKSTVHDKAPEIILVKKKFSSVTILATCRFIDAEAAPIVAQKLRYISSQPMRYIVDADCAISFAHHEYGLLQMVLKAASGNWDYDCDFDSSEFWCDGRKQDVVAFVADSMMEQSNKIPADDSTFINMEVAFRAVSHHEDNEGDEEPAEEITNMLSVFQEVLHIDSMFESFLVGLRRVDEIYCQEALLTTPRPLLRLSGRQGLILKVWEKCLEKEVLSTAKWPPLPELNDGIWKKEWEECEFL